MPVFRSSSPERFELVGTEPSGRRRVVVAEKFPDDFNWKMRLIHPSGQTWPATFHGPNVLDAMAELLASKDVEFKQDASRGDRPPAEAKDTNVRVYDDGSLAAPQFLPRR
jgi:hypothetical protein